MRKPNVVPAPSLALAQRTGPIAVCRLFDGFQAGPYNLISVSSPGPVDPENIKAYEVGGKHDLPFLNHEHLDCAVFYYNYSNRQVSIQEPGIGGETASQKTTAGYYHNSGFYFDPGDEIEQKAYNLVNLYVVYEPQGARWSLAAWIKNAFNATALGARPPSPYVMGGFYNDPRLFGLGASVRY